LTSGAVPLRSWKKLCASSTTTTTSGQAGEGPRCQASVTPSTLAMAACRSAISRCTRDEVDAWSQDLYRLGEEGLYFFSLNRYLFLAHR
jgi:hypothetical protein